MGERDKRYKAKLEVFMGYATPPPRGWNWIEDSVKPRPCGECRNLPVYITEENKMRGWCNALEHMEKPAPCDRFQQMTQREKFRRFLLRLWER